MENNDLDLNLEELDQIEANSANKLQVKDRFAKLSEKVTLSRQEKEAAEAKALAEADRASQIEKERDFYKSFSQISSKHPAASEYQDQILERVNKGADTEEATIAVLYKEGKLNSPQPQIENVAGGSAPNSPHQGDKDFSEMDITEKREVLLGLEKSGELDRLLRR